MTQQRQPFSLRQDNNSSDHERTRNMRRIIIVCSRTTIRRRRLHWHGSVKLFSFVLCCLFFLSTQQNHVAGFTSPTTSSTFRLASSRHDVRTTMPKKKPLLLGTTITPSRSSTKTRTALQGWEDVVYHAESAASNLAALSLQNDPSNLVASLPVMYAAGLLTSLSPCVWGLLPLTMSYISTAAGERSDGKTTLPTLAFAAGLAVVFCSLGVTAAQLGGVFGSNTSGSALSDNLNLMAFLSNAVVLVMGLQLLELIKVPLPSLDLLRNQVNPLGGSNRSVSNGLLGSSAPAQPILLDGTGQILDTGKDKDKKKQEEQGSLFRTFLLGGSSALVASPCATPVLTSILAFVAKTQNPLLGGALLLGYTLGYSTPLLLLASTGGQALNDLRQKQAQGGMYATLAQWVTPFTGGILLWYGTNGVLTALLGDPSLAGLAVLE